MQTLTLEIAFMGYRQIDLLYKYNKNRKFEDRYEFDLT